MPSPFKSAGGSLIKPCNKAIIVLGQPLSANKALTSMQQVGGLAHNTVAFHCSMTSWSGIPNVGHASVSRMLRATAGNMQHEGVATRLQVSGTRGEGRRGGQGADEVQSLYLAALAASDMAQVNVEDGTLSQFVCSRWKQSR